MKKDMSIENQATRTKVKVQPYFRKHYNPKYTCGHCNSKLHDKDNYCPNCGYKVIKLRTFNEDAKQ